MRPIDFWFSIGSTYSFLTVMRLPVYVREHGVKITWRPFNVRSIMIEQKNIPFADKPSKSAYMWRDIERRAAKYGLSASLPAPYPLQNLALANQVALLGMKEGWGEDYAVATYRRWFQQGEPAGSEPNLSDSLKEIGQDPVRIIEIANSAQIEDALALETEKAKTLGVFGAPSFLVDGEVFWGDDRLDDAVSWARSGRVV
ncbi:2-hydroxychromene-2-carboxylate isomerase [Ruegeria sp. 1NDH52C]|uniref:2-hydroxychromene-2-carboxylate isomerase n=2 Tax=Ruegeria alba TaxID=2916756 RepID=A0ABS9P2R9_9RHOB|nr:2-hydroxychromene-2-carboxylate isomerase [Ruegeria alba]MCG6560802.1 2-hydroxychromene-2-carboxylate isomerase [Ruegeria alba]